MTEFSPLVSAEWLHGRLGDADIRVLDCTVHLHPLPGGDMRAESGRADFESSHVPGAVFADLIGDLSDPDSALRFTLPTANRFAEAMGQLGVGASTHVVLYAHHVHWATRVWWMLRHFGFDQASILDGGLKAWKAAGYSVEDGPGAAYPPAHFPVTETRDLFCDMAQVRDAVGDAGTVTINALMAEQHAGTGGPHYGRPGRIPGSISLPARDLVDPATGLFRPLEDLRADFAAAGALDRPVITYCGGGIAASGDSFVLHLLGQDDVKIYDASLQEWAKSDAPMETDATA